MRTIDLPETWKVVRLKDLASFRQESLPENTNPDYRFRYVDIGAVEHEKGINEYKELVFSEAPSRARKRVKAGDTIISTVRTYLKAIAAIDDSEDVIVSTGFAVLSPQLCIPKFLTYLASSDFICDEINKLSWGVSYPAISESQMGRIHVPLPPVEEQKRIVRYLDKQTANLLQNQKLLQQQIDILERYKKSLIHEAVTKGLDSDASMKPSGVDWMGDIPEHWSISKLKYVLERPLQYGSNETGDSTLENAPRYVRITDITTDGNLKEEDAQYLDPKLAYPYILSEGDVLFARSGATVGKTFLYHESDGWACFAGYLIRARANRKKAIPEFLYYFTQGSGYGNWISRMYSQATIQNIGADKYSLLVIPLPQIPEQQEIVHSLDVQCSKVDAIVEIKRKQIEVLKKRRQSLIYECVIGKRRVGKES